MAPQGGGRRLLYQRERRLAAMGGWQCKVISVAMAAMGVCVEAAGACTTQDGRCVCETEDSGESWDVTEIASAEITTTGDTTGCTSCQGSWNYHFSLCGNVVMPQAIGCASSQTRAAYRIDEYPTPSSRWCEYMAEDATSNPPAVTPTNDGFSLQYTYTSGSISRSLTVNLLCNGEDLPAPEPGATGGADVILNWPTAAACSGGMIGWYIVIFTGVAAGLYVGGGIGYGKRENPNADIASAHPHVHHWQQLPGLVADGVYVTRLQLSTHITALSFLAPSEHEMLGDVEDIASGETGGLLKKEGAADTAQKKSLSWAGIPDAREEDEETPRRKIKKKKKTKKKKPKPAVEKSDEI